MHKNKRGGRTKYAHAINQTITTAPTAGHQALQPLPKAKPILLTFI